MYHTTVQRPGEGGVCVLGVGGGLSPHTYGPSPLVNFAVVSLTIDLTSNLLSLLVKRRQSCAKSPLGRTLL